MSKQIIKLSDNAAEKIKQIMSKAENSAIGVRVGVKSGGCAGMSYVMEYTNEAKPNEEMIEEKGVKNIEVYVNANGYACYDKMDIDYLENRCKAFLPRIHYYRTERETFPFSLKRQRVSE